MNEIDWLTNQTTNSPLSKSSPADSLDNAKRLMALFDNPQDSAPAIHVAGTMGKGTVTKLITNILVAHGKNVVSLYSPHTYDQRERIESNSEMISQDDFVDLITKLQTVETGRMTYFNAMMLMGVLYAQQQRADVIVVETGLGGQYDTSNTITRTDKICVLTKIGFDHTKILGDTLEQIATEKAGIIHSDNRVFCYGQQPTEAVEIFDQKVEHVAAHISYSKHTDFDPKEHNHKLAGSHNRFNVQLAFDAAAELLGEDFDENIARQSLDDFALPGRFDVVETGNTTFVFDTAHNIAEITALQQTWSEVYGDKKPGLIFASSNPEQAAQCLDLLSDWCRPIITTKYSEPTLDLWKPAIDVSVDGALRTSSTREAVQQMKQQYPDQKFWLITGSTYHLGELFSQL